MRAYTALGLALALTSTAQADKLVLFAGADDKPDASEASKAKLVQPFGVDFSPEGRIVYIVEMAKGERLRGITEKGTITTLAGRFGEKGFTGNDGSGIDARFNGMH